MGPRWVTIRVPTHARHTTEVTLLSEATACPPSVVADTIMRTIELGVTITDAAVDEKATTIFCAPVTRDPRCPDCGRYENPLLAVMDLEAGPGGRHHHRHGRD